MNDELSDGQQYATFHHSVAGGDIDGRDGTSLFGLDIVLHLHSLQHDDHLTSSHGITDLDINGRDCSRQRSPQGIA